MTTAVETYWTGHVVRPEPFGSADESLAYLAWRSEEYPLFHQLMGLWGNHSADTVLDYGCGPANDTIGFLVHGRAREVIGADVSTTSLGLAEHRLRLHGLDRWRLVKVSDADPVIPLPDASVDHIYCQGVLHHVSHPADILREFRRVLRPGGTAAVMAYSRDSLFFHQYVPWKRQIIRGIDAGLPVDEAFTRSTDGPECPVSRAYRPAEFVGLCEAAGFEAAFRGGYFSAAELRLWRRYRQQAIHDPRLAPEHRAFLRGLREIDGFPCHNGLPAGIGGVYWLTR